MARLLEIEELRTYFFMHGYAVRAVDGVSFHIDEGETLGIVGESGCGKSQTSMSIMGLVPNPPGRIIGGSIKFKGEDLVQATRTRMQEIRGNEIAMIFQEPMTSLNPVFNIGFQIGEVLRLHRDMSEKESLDEAARLLDMVGISDPTRRIKEYPFQLSGGLRQRVMIAMAMACQPSLLIADEPTTALDVTIQAQILRLMSDLKEKQNMANMFITHDLAVIANFTERVVVMYAGVVVENSPVKEVFKEPLHPYTEGLLASIPVLGTRDYSEAGLNRRLSAIPGNLPDHKNYPKGCRFAPRCTKAMAKCWEQEPALVTLNNGRQVRCFLHSDQVQEPVDMTNVKELQELAKQDAKNKAKEAKREAAAAKGAQTNG